MLHGKIIKTNNNDNSIKHYYFIFSQSFHPIYKIYFLNIL